MNLDNPVSNSQAEVGSQVTEDARDVFESMNLVERILKKKNGQDLLVKIGQDCKRDYDIDLETRRNWEDEIEEWMNLACQIREQKNFPWRDASNIKYPLISVAAIQFSARAYPSFIPPDGKLVKTTVVGPDPTGEKSKKGERIGTFMSWQILRDMEDWEEDMDKLLITLAVVGIMFKKTFYDPHYDKIRSVLVDARDLVVNHWSKSLETAERVSERFYFFHREVKEKMRNGTYHKCDLSPPTLPDGSEVSASNLETVPYLIIEQHCWLTIDDDEDAPLFPVVVTFEYNSGKVLRITPRFDKSGVILDSKGVIKRIDPHTYYTKYSFIPNPDGGFYDIGFGHLLGPINESVNTLVNQLVDAGTLNNMQAGFIGKGLRIKGGDYNLSPGEFKWVNSTVDDLKKQIMLMPTKEPSKVLFELMGALITSGKELASVAEIFVGKMPGQNTPATTTMASIEQGMKVFTAVYKRVYRSLDKEFKKIFKLNKTYLDENTYISVLDGPVSPMDFDNKSFDIIPSADPTATSQTEKLLKAQGLMELLPLGTIDPIKVTMRILEAQQQPNWQELIPGMVETGQPQIPPKQDPELMAQQQESMLKQQEFQMKGQAEAQKMAMTQRDKEFNLKMQAQQQQQDRQHAAEMNNLKAESARRELNIETARGMQKLQQERETAKLKQQQMKESSSAKKRNPK